MSLSEDKLRDLFDIMKENHPEALDSALQKLSLQGTDDNSPGEVTSEENKPPPSIPSETDGDDAPDPPEDDIIAPLASDVSISKLRIPDSPQDKGVSEEDMSFNTTETSFHTAAEFSEANTITTLGTLGTLAEGSTSADAPKEDIEMQKEKGCYLYYDSDSAKLMLQYATQKIPDAIGFYTSTSIPEFKYTRNLGRSELIGNCASGVTGRKNYYSGWCQYVRAARSSFRLGRDGKKDDEDAGLWIFSRPEGQQGLDVDVYVYNGQKKDQILALEENTKICASDFYNIDAVACLPKHADFFGEVKRVDLGRWMTEASYVGAGSRFTDGGMTGTADDTEYEEEEAEAEAEADKEIKDSAPEAETQSPPSPTPLEETSVGCYLIYDPSTCKLMLYYSKAAVPNAIGFYSAGPGHSIQEFKFKRNSGRVELIGNCASGVAGRKNFYSGWCQFVRAAASVNGPITIYPRGEQQGLDVDVYVYYKDPDNAQIDVKGQQTIKLTENVANNVTGIDAVACLPKYTEFFGDVKFVGFDRWLTEGNTIGAISRLS